MFDVTPEQQKRINEFIKEQDKITGGYYGAIGGGTIYKFIPTSLGVIFNVENSVTGHMIDLTDYESW